jgi:hypothetical protein
MPSKIVTIEFEVEVEYQDVHESYGEDADGNRGIEITDRIPLFCTVLNKDVPKEVQAYLKVLAIEKFEEGS